MRRLRKRGRRRREDIGDLTEQFMAERAVAHCGLRFRREIIGAHASEARAHAAWDNEERRLMNLSERLRSGGKDDGLYGEVRVDQFRSTWTGLPLSIHS